MKERGVVLIAVTVLVAVIGFLAALATSQRRQVAALEARFIERREIELLKLSIERLVLADLKAGKSFPRTYRIGDFKARVEISKEARRLDLNRVSPDDLAEALSEAEIPEDLIVRLVQSLKKLREDKRQFFSLSDPVRFGWVDPYRYWISPGLYRFFTVYDPGALRLEMTLEYHRKIYYFISILTHNYKPLFNKII